MRYLSLMALFVFVGCAGSDSKGDTANAKNLGELTDQSQDGSDPTALACSSEVQLECGEGAVDGCTISREATDDGTGEVGFLTNYHICVPQEESASHPPCEEEILRECPEGFVDACGLQPAASTVHACVEPPDGAGSKITETAGNEALNGAEETTEPEASED